MNLGTCFIAPEQGKKGRSFSGQLLGYATADALWQGGAIGDGIRPVFASWACSHGEAGPFVANLRLGRKAVLGDRPTYSRRKATYVELLRSADYVYSTEKFQEGVVVTAYLQSLFVLDPGMVDPVGGIRFVILPPGKPIEGDGGDSKAGPREHETIRRLAPSFAAFVDRRSRAPLIPEPSFFEALLTACLDAGLATLSSTTSWGRQWGRGLHGYEEHNLGDLGLGDGVAMKASHTQFETVLADAVRRAA